MHFIKRPIADDFYNFNTVLYVQFILGPISLVLFFGFLPAHRILLVVPQVDDVNFSSPRRAPSTKLLLSTLWLV